jgi:signal transduction histidine kinase
MEVKFQWQPGDVSMNKELKWNVYKIIQGYLTSAYLYSRLLSADVKLRSRKNNIILNIYLKKGLNDDTTNPSSYMIELIELRERAISIGGTTSIRFLANNIEKINVTLPVKSP